MDFNKQQTTQSFAQSERSGRLAVKFSLTPMRITPGPTLELAGRDVSKLNRRDRKVRRGVRRVFPKILFDVIRFESLTVFFVFSALSSATSAVKSWRLANPFFLKHKVYPISHFACPNAFSRAGCKKNL